MSTLIKAIIECIVGLFRKRSPTSHAQDNVAAPDALRTHVADRLRAGTKSGSGTAHLVPRRETDGPAESGSGD